MRKRTIALATSALAASLLLAGCSTTMNTMPMGESPTSDQSFVPFVDADIDFAMLMVEHHRQAVEMADEILGKSDIDARVVDLAERIKAAQEPEIEQMTVWLEDWGAGGMTGMDHGMGDTMSEDDTAALEAATGADASRLFLQQMIVHHQGAIEMAQDELETGLSPDALDLAERIVNDQTAEIAEMTELAGLL